jgi:hypothetical protein
VILERDGHMCQVCGPKCTHNATAVDHIIPIADGGAKFDPSNLRAICTSCNNWRAQRQKHFEGWRRSATQIILVTCPPGACSWAGDYVKEHALSGDFIIDYSSIAVTLGLNDSKIIRSVRNAFLGRMRAGDIAAPRVWLTSTRPDALEWYPHHDVIEIDPGYENVSRLCPPDLRRRMEEWYARRAGPERTANRRQW